MTCPYCNGEMERGVMYGRDRMLWSKKKYMMSLPEMHDDIVILGKYSVFKGGETPAYLCRQCHKVVIDYTPVQNDML